MRAIQVVRYGKPEDLVLREMPDPTPGKGELLIRTHAASVNALDWRVCQGEPALVRAYTGLLRPHKCPVMGADVAGIVEAVGSGVTRFQVGDHVFGELGATGMGGFSELSLVNEGSAASKPADMSWAEAASLGVAGLTAIQGLRDWGNLQPGQHVLVTGASGGVGSFTIQVAKAMGAQVTALTSPGKVDFVLGLGADHVIDRTKEDFTAAGARFDMIYDAGARRPIRETVRALKPGGVIVFVGGGSFLEAMLLAPLRMKFGNKRYASGTAKPVAADLEALARLFEQGKLKPAIDQIYPLAEAGRAVAHVAAGAAMGKTVIQIIPES